MQKQILNNIKPILFQNYSNQKAIFSNTKSNIKQC